MGRQLGALAALVLGVLGFAVPAQAGERALPMRFELRQDGAAENCGSKCRLWVFAFGAITSETAVEFRNFSTGRDLRGATLVLDSDGGSVLGAIALGRAVRELNLASSVGRMVEQPSTAPGLPRATVSPLADCESMCAFVLLAGTQRSVPAQARVMVHQIWLGDRREDPTAATYSAEDLVLVQRDVGRLAKYTADMGGPVELLELALRIPPWEPMHALTRDELRRTQLDTQTVAVADAPLPVQTATVAFTAGASGTRVSALNEQGWAMVDLGGGSVLSRRHPLTIEGDEIGSFDLMVSCGADDGYLITYLEERRLDDNALLAPLTDVTLRIGNQSVALKLVSSEMRAQSGVLASVASGSLPGALMRNFTASGSRSMMVGTTSDKLRTVIRVGNSGAGRNLPQLAARCQKGAGTRADLPGSRTGGLAQRQ